MRSLNVQCTAAARTRSRPPGALAQIERIIAAAEAEFRLFDGHVIGDSGHIIKFGSVETEDVSAATEHDESRSLRDVPWRRVARYWEIVQRYRQQPRRELPSIAADPHPSLGVNWIANAFAADLEQTSRATDIMLRLLLPALEVIASDPEVELKGLDATDIAKVGPLLKDADKLVPGQSRFTIDAARLKDLLRQALIRSSVSDVAWSAAFVSAVMEQAGVPRESFLQNSSHVRYIRQAVDNAIEMLNGQPSNATYRACDIYKTPVRPGDLVCYHRDPRYDLANPEAKAEGRLFVSVTRDYAEQGKLPFLASHCDIVVAVDRKSGKATSIGGNVNQAVTKRRINLTRSGVLAVDQGQGCRARKRGTAARDGSELIGSQVPDNRCNLNMQSWFTLLQYVDGGG